MFEPGDKRPSVIPRPWLHGSTLSVTLGDGLTAWERFGEQPALVEGCRRLGQFVLPPFQRPFVWTDEQCVKFIESIWLELPIASYVMHQDICGPFDRWLIDGQQRWTAIYRYAAGEFPVFGHEYPALPRIDHWRFEMRVFPRIETQRLTFAELRDVYERLAYGGTPHVRPAPPVLDTPEPGEEH